MNDRVLVVTGGASGIGLATANEWVARGGRAGVLDLDPDRVAVSDGLESVRADVTVEHDVAAGVEKVLARFGRIDAAFHSAGVLGPPAAIDDFDVEAWRTMVDTHLTGALLLAKHVAPQLVQGGSLVFASSISAVRGSVSHPAYAAAKGALSALTRSLARALGPRRIRVNVVLPGSIVGTRLLGRDLGVAELAQLAAATPLRRLGQPQDVAAAVCFLCSDAARHVTGTELVVDGGESLGN